jgi:hypothetical protein
MRKFDVVYASCPFGGLPPNVSIAANGGVPYGSPANKKPAFMAGFLFARDFGVKRTPQIRRICLF